MHDNTVRIDAQPVRSEGFTPPARAGRLKGLPNLLSIAVLTLVTVPLLFIYVWLILISFGDKMVNGILPQGFTFRNWSFLWSELKVDGMVYPSIWGIFANTLIIAVGSSVLEVSAGLMAGYVISRSRFPGRNGLLHSTMLTHAFPAVTSLIASFYILNELGLINTLGGIILLKGFAGLGMSTWIIKGFFDDVPKELEWASSVDGGSRIRTFAAVYLPLVWPGIVAVSLFAFLSGWGEYIMVSVFLFDDDINTLSLIVRSLFSETSTASYGVVMAVGSFYMLPCLILYFFSQRALMRMKM
ncbi:carbohydrate ABC transporter permease [Paenibacillus sp. MWE-103]|uniref:Carbohydrate ABC transporter permease n=1 Tax=Paenibacillus artemisiicola TaxID=1172618 RepID=A0ABS3WFT4_9BACL|nr:carbohydrate ABC transporter permease [Paenibacillus artemisiicola]MBO7747147.1 carbohydrate ABC transporter permease [Paenibacillus artemisiicola]